MALNPGKNYVNSPLRLSINLQNADGDDTDPATVALDLKSPAGIETTYVYLTDSELQKTDAGDYTCDVTPDEAGRWVYRWRTTGTGTTLREFGDFLVQYSPFDDDDAWLMDYAV